MPDERNHRKLTAILNADVVGYSRLMGLDEPGTHDRVKSLRAEVIDAKVAAYHGRVVNVAGDGFLVEFPSAVDAVQYALDVQRIMARRNQDVQESRRLELRIGINVGDVIVDADDIFGDGVNVAVRLEGLATPGGICISRTVYDQVRNKLDLDVADLGLQTVKNIAGPVQAYRIGVDGAPVAGEKRTRPIYRRPLAVSVSVFLLIAAVAVVNSRLVQDVWTRLPFPGEDAATSPAPILDRPSVAVLPFNNLSEDPSQEYFADGMSEDLITDLSRISGLFVISRNSTFVYKGKSVDVRAVGRELGVSYVLEGSVRKVANKLRINAQLVDVKSRAHLWAKRYDRELTDIFKVQDEISAKIVTALKVTLTSNEALKSGKPPTQDFHAYDAYLRGWAHYRRNTFVDYPKAVVELEKAIELDPKFSLAHAALAATHLLAMRSGWATASEPKSPVEEMMISFETDLGQLRDARRHLQEAMKKPAPLAHRVAAEIATLDRNYDKAIQHISEAIQLDPNDAESYAALSITLTWSGAAEKAVEPIRKAMRLNPHYPPIYLAYLGVAEFSMGRYAESAELLERSAARNPGNDWLLVHLIAAYGHIGQEESARRTLDKLNALTAAQNRPEYTVKEESRRTPYKLEKDQFRLLIGLHKAKMRNILLPNQ